MASGNTEIDKAENQIRSIITNIGAKKFGIALNNASAFGDVFGDSITDEDLTKWFVGVDLLVATGQHIDKGTR